MPTIQITTVTANFIKHDSKLTELDAINTFKATPEDIPVYITFCNDAGEQLADYGNKGIVPSIWTHTPVPVNFPIIAVQAKFEERAADVLGDEMGAPCFDKCADRAMHRIKDNRYWSVAVRCAWMMYLDLAIEQFNNK